MLLKKKTTKFLITTLKMDYMESEIKNPNTDQANETTG